MLKEFLYYLLLHLVRLYLRIQIQFFEDFYQASNYQWALPPLFAQLLLTHLKLNRLFLVLVAVMRLEVFYQASHHQWTLPPLFAQLLLTHLNLNRLFFVLVAVMRLVLVQRLSMELIPYATVTVSPQMQMKILKTFIFFPSY